MLSKSERLAEILRERIARGDYLSAPLPSERVLAEQEGISYMTARKSVQMLIASGLLARAPGGRLVVNQTGTLDVRHLQVACIVPSFPSLDVLNWRLAIDRVLAERQATAKVLAYTHWEDPQIRHALERCDGAFLYPIASDLPPRMLDLLLSRRVVMLDQDYAGRGIPSICLTAESAIEHILDHLVERGHRRIGCINLQPHDPCIRGRIAGWRSGLERRKLKGMLVDQPVYIHTHPTEAARELATSCPLTDTAIFATTASAAVGINRGFHDRGLRVGTDIALCTLNGEGQAHMCVPSITAIAPVSPDRWLRQALLWMEEAKPKKWSGPLLMEPAKPAIVIGESSSRAFPTTAKPPS
jgi:DNA-binding LacI/PurR family transcriptional regulator